jgi:hypothetical protein
MPLKYMKFHPYLSKQPHPSKQTPDSNEEPEPDLPSDSGPLCHPQHSPHGTFQLDPCIVETVIHLVCEGRRVADLVTDGNGKLLELADFGG